ncbi:MAG: hypothetical protein K5837_02205 [Candidatus Saccharibacteria bacterium]|nr:hypothetical protein [Candidatus Saccharibacteria bacterium]
MDKETILHVIVIACSFIAGFVTAKITDSLSSRNNGHGYDDDGGYDDDDYDGEDYDDYEDGEEEEEEYFDDEDPDEEDYKDDPNNFETQVIR